MYRHQTDDLDDKSDFPIHLHRQSADLDTSMEYGNTQTDGLDKQTNSRNSEIHCFSVLQPNNTLKLAIHLSFLAFRHVRALFRELLREIANQSLYTSHNIADFVHLRFCKKLDEKLSLCPL